MPKPKKEKLPAKCIGLASEMSEEQLAGKHIARGGYVFETEEDYLNHTSPLTGHKPTDFEHQVAMTDGRFAKVSEKAIERGEAHEEAEE